MYEVPNVPEGKYHFEWWCDPYFCEAPVSAREPLGHDDCDLFYPGKETTAYIDVPELALRGISGARDDKPGKMEWGYCLYDSRISSWWYTSAGLAAYRQLYEEAEALWPGHVKGAAPPERYEATAARLAAEKRSD